MTDTDRLMDLLVEWDERHRAGYEISAEQLCPDDPKLREELHARIVKRRKLQAVLDGSNNVPKDREPIAPAIPEVDGFDILEVIGSGGMGIVYRARDRKLNRMVALKMILGGSGASGPELNRFRVEAEAVAKLQHPNIVQIYEIGETGGRPYLALEYVAGGTLTQRLGGKPVSPRLAAELLLPLADAVHHAHEQGVVHRDLKPANILLTDHGTPKVADFGLAKRLDIDHGHTQTGSILGSPSYMAPEQASGRLERIGPATDVYALGAILYELLTGRPPFQAETPFEVLELVVYQEVVPPTRLRPKTPRDLETICIKCLEKEPRQRYASAGDLAADLRRFLNGEPVLARPVSSAERIWRWCRRNPRVAALTSALALVFVAGVAGIIWQWQRAEQEARAVSRKHDEAELARASATAQRDRADANSRRARDAVERMTRVGLRLREQRGQEEAGRTIVEEAVRFHEGFIADKSDDPEVILDAARAWNKVAICRDQLGQHVAAVEAQRRAIGLFDLLLARGPSPALIYERARNSRRFGHVLLHVNRTTEAADAYEQAIAGFRGLLDEYPDNRDYRVDLANSLTNLAVAIEEQFPNRAEPLLVEALALHERNLEDFPDNSLFRTEKALLQETLGLFLWARDRSPRASSLCLEARDTLRQLSIEAPNDMQRRWYAARTNQAVGHIAASDGRFADAEQAFSLALTELDRLGKEFPRDASYSGQKLSAMVQLGFAQNKAGRHADAEATYRKALTTYRSMASEYPDLAHGFRDTLSDLHKWFWELLMGAGRVMDAAEFIRQVERANPPDAVALSALASAITNTLDPKNRDMAQAVRLARRATELDPSEPSHWTILGENLARAGEAAEAIKALTKSANLQRAYSVEVGLLLALAKHRLGENVEARMGLDEARAWLEKNGTLDPKHLQLRDEVAGIIAGK